VLLCLLSGASVAAAAEETTPAAPEEEHVTRVLRWISIYEPVYLAVDAEDTSDAKFQVSFKYRLVNPDGPVTRKAPALGNLYLSYTQTSLWDIDAESRPFRDTSHRPRVFYYDEHIDRWSGDHFRAGLESGAGHESNGRANSQSRSLEMLYLKPVLTFETASGVYWSAAPMFMSYFRTEENPDIARYRGHVELHLSARKPDGWVVAAQIRRGTDSSLGSVEINASYPLEKVGLGAFLGFLHLQYFNGRRERRDSLNGYPGGRHLCEDRLWQLGRRNERPCRQCRRFDQWPGSDARPEQ
jgi:outer membrane phospholipase A